MKSRLPENGEPRAEAPVRKTKKTGKREDSAPAIKILIIDDDAELADIIIRSLDRTQQDYVIKHEVLAKNGLFTARDWMPDLIILDVHFPDENGLTILSQLKKDKRTENIFTVLATADTTKKTTIKALENKPDGILYKPFTIDRLELEFYHWFELIKAREDGPTIHFENGFLRKHSRLPLRTNITYRISEKSGKGEFRQAVTQDVSGIGLSIRLVELPEDVRNKISQIGTKIEFHIQIPGENTMVKDLTGEVKNFQTIEEGNQKTDIVGMSYLNTPNEIKSRLVHAAFSRLQSRIKKRIFIGVTIGILLVAGFFSASMFQSKIRVEKKLDVSETKRLELEAEKSVLASDVENLKNRKITLEKQTRDLNQKMLQMQQKERNLDATIKRKEARILELEGLVKDLTDEWLKFLERQKEQKANDSKL